MVLVFVASSPEYLDKVHDDHCAVEKALKGTLTIRTVHMSLVVVDVFARRVRCERDNFASAVMLCASRSCSVSGHASSLA